MRSRDLFELLLLAALWGSSFLFMRLGAVDFGPVALVFLRVGGAAAVLLPLLMWRGEFDAMRRHWKPIAVVGLTNSALPFALYMVALLGLSTGLASIFNATAPLWGALIAWAWLGDKPTPLRALGLAIGFAGVLGLGLGNASFKSGEHGISPALAIACCIGATMCYGWSVNFTKRHLAGVPPLALATGSQLSAALLTLPTALWWWPAQTPGPMAWLGAAALSVGCTGIAYLLYFRLIAHIGPARAIAVTFLIPAFAMLWGALFLGETLTLAMLAGCAVILFGTALAIGVIRAKQPAAAAR
ncbi:MAG: DMT family transporter [Rubrivivax sp.]